MKNLLVAGGNSGIGLKLVEKLSADGHQITCACRSAENIVGLKGVETVAFDATQVDVNFALPDSLDGFVYCPGTINLKPFNRLNDADFLNDFEVNVLGAVRLLRHILPALKKGKNPSVVLFSTVAVQTGMPFHASISAAKGAIEGLTRSLAAELAPKIRVNAIAPSLTDTPLASMLLSSDEKRQASAERHPLKQVGDPSDFADLTAFLLSDASKFSSGQIYKMDGGLSAVKTF